MKVGDSFFEPANLSFTTHVHVLDKSYTLDRRDDYVKLSSCQVLIIAH